MCCFVTKTFLLYLESIPTTTKDKNITIAFVNMSKFRRDAVKLANYDLCDGRDQMVKMIS